MVSIELLAGIRQSGESNRAVQACNDYLRAGPGRSAAALLREYAKRDKTIPPTKAQGTIKRWASRYDWSGRAALYDGTLERQKNERAIEIMQNGLALTHERVVKLTRLSDFLEAQLYEQGEQGVYHNLWVPDVKQIGSGDSAERVDLERFNAPLIEQYRGALDDIAKETGGRKQHLEHSGEICVPVTIIEVVRDPGANDDAAA